jgi:hypothetical protein
MNRKTIIGLLIAAVCLTSGVYLIHDHQAAVPPDTATASPDELVAFMLSDYFNRLSPDEQRRFTEAAMKRYASMTDPQREAVEARIKEMRENNPEQLREQATRVWKQFIVHEAEQYVQLPPAERKAWLDGRIAVWKAMGANGRGPSGEVKERREQREKYDEQPLSPQKQEKVIGFFQTEVFPRTSARERALVLTLMKDAAPKMRPKD